MKKKLLKIFFIVFFNITLSFSHELKFIIPTKESKSIKIKIESSKTVLNLKKKISSKLNLNPSRLRIIFAGKEYPDTTKLEILVENEIKLVHLIIK